MLAIGESRNDDWDCLPLSQSNLNLRMATDIPNPVSAVIHSHPATLRRYLKEVWESREIALLLARRDLLVRYRRSIVGFLWVLFKPGMNTVVLSLVFGHLARLPDHGLPYPVLVLSAGITWQFFAGVFTEAGGSVVHNAALVTKVFFPRLLLPISTLPVNTIDLAVGLILLILLMAWHGLPPGLNLALLPLALLPLAWTAIGAGLWAAALLPRYKDLKNVIPYLLQFGMLISPVAFSSSLVPENWRWLYGLNPLVAPLDLCRWCVLGNAYPLAADLILPSLASGLVLLGSGLWAFKRFEREFADAL